MDKINILINKIDRSYLDNNYSELLKGLYKDRKEAVKKFNNKAAVYPSMTAGLMLMRVYEKLYGESGCDIIVKKGESGKPYIFGRDGFKFNISHSGDYVVMAYYLGEKSCELGIDIEKIKPRDEDMRIANRFFTKSEIDYISDGLECSDIDSRFYKVWTMKEAYIKMTGKGLSQRLDSFSVYPEELTVTDADTCKLNSDINYDMRIIDNYVISVCAAGIGKAEYCYSQITLDKPLCMR